MGSFVRACCSFAYNWGKTPTNKYFLCFFVECHVHHYTRNVTEKSDRFSKYNHWDSVLIFFTNTGIWRFSWGNSWGFVPQLCSAILQNFLQFKHSSLQIRKSITLEFTYSMILRALHAWGVARPITNILLFWMCCFSGIPRVPRHHCSWRRRISDFYKSLREILVRLKLKQGKRHSFLLPNMMMLSYT